MATAGTSMLSKRVKANVSATANIAQQKVTNYGGQVGLNIAL